MTDNHINYIEFKARDLEITKTFYSQAFGWVFTDYGPTYIAFEESGMAGGFEKWDDPIQNGALIVLYHKDLDSIKAKILNAGGSLTKDIFAFPGGHRFHFQDPSGNEMAIWSDKYGNN